MSFSIDIIRRLLSSFEEAREDVQGRRWQRARDALQDAPVLDAQQLVARHSQQIGPQIVDMLQQLVGTANKLWQQVAPHAGAAGPPASPPARVAMPPPLPFPPGGPPMQQPFTQQPYMQPQVPLQPQFVSTHAPPPPPPPPPPPAQAAQAGARPQLAVAEEEEEGFGEQFQASRD